MVPAEYDQAVDEAMAALPDAPARRAEQLTEREAVLYARSRQAAIQNILEDLERARPQLPGPDAATEAADIARARAGGYTSAIELIAGIANRIERIAPVPELPDAPCAIAGEIAGRPVLCAWPAGHEPLEVGSEDPHSWSGLERPAPAPARPPVLLPAVNRILRAAARGILDDLEYRETR